MKRIPTSLLVLLLLSFNCSALSTVWDYDGDGKTDFALYGGKSLEYGDARFRVIRSSDGQFVSVRFGRPLDADRPIPGDFDGDGKTDFAVYRRGTNENPQNYFYIPGSSSGFQAISWGNAALFDYTPMTQMNSAN